LRAVAFLPLELVVRGPSHSFSFTVLGEMAAPPGPRTAGLVSQNPGMSAWGGRTRARARCHAAMGIADPGASSLALGGGLRRRGLEARARGRAGWAPSARRRPWELQRARLL